MDKQDATECLELLSANFVLNRVCPHSGCMGSRSRERVWSISFFFFFNIQIPGFYDYDHTLEQQDELGGTQFLTPPREKSFFFIIINLFFSDASACNNDAS